jgi:DNA-directed RNA polymerase subunit beta'
VTQDLVVIEEDCATMNGLNMRALVEGGEVIESLRDRILGRVAAVDVVGPETQEVLLRAGEMLDEDVLDELEGGSGRRGQGAHRADLLDALRHLCQVLRARPRPWRADQRRRGDRRDRGAVDRRAGHAADDAHVPHRRRGLAGGGRLQRRRQVDGTVGFNPTMRYVTNGKGELVVISRSGEIVITDQHGRERERHKVPYGALLGISADQQIKAWTVLANWDPLTRPIITEFAGGRSSRTSRKASRSPSSSTRSPGLSTLVVIDPKRRGATKVVRPQVKLLDPAGNEVKIPGTDHSVTIGFPIGS